MNDRELAQRVIEEVLSQPEFQPEKVGEFKFLQKILRTIGEILQKIMDFISDLIFEILSRVNLGSLGSKFLKLGPVARVIINVLAILIVGALVFFLVKLVLKIIKSKRFRFKKEDISDELEEFTKTPSEPLRLALEFKRIKEFRLSFRYFFLALLINFNERELIRIQKFKTNRQYFRELSANDSEIAKASEPFFEAFYYIWYGKRDIGMKELLEWERLYYDLSGGLEEGENDE
ncbi:MAG TPA: hypothetical protein PLI11_05555 [Clostridia bacterium]|jgi:large-conductance mechanosensitive channel|nr:hypothetical protein [Clostridia bacterium]HPZ52362.1 hypothetical protein [Clostridia bacterium]